MDTKDQLKDTPIDQVAESLGLGLQGMCRFGYASVS